MIKKRVASATITRLAVYRQALLSLERRGKETVSSKDLGERAGSNASQVRKDLSFFGEFGEPGRGYNVLSLEKAVSRILGLNKRWKVAVVGAGRLGMALLAYPGFQKEGFDIRALFDNDPHKIGRRRRGVTVQAISRLSWAVEKEGIRIGVIATPAEAAQGVANQFIACGIKAILNFAPAHLTTPEKVELRNVDLSMELERLSYFLTSPGK